MARGKEPDNNTVQGPFATGEINADGYTVFTSILKEEFVQDYENRVNNAPEHLRSAETKRFIEEFRAQGIEPFITVSAEVVDGKYTQLVPEEFWNVDYMYTWVEDKDGNPVTVHTNDANVAFGNPNTMSQFQSGTTAAPEPFFNRIYNRDFAVMFDYIAHLDIVSHDTTENPANVGDEVTAEVTGTLSPLVNRVVWFREDGSILEYKDADGNTVKANCEITSTADLGECGTIRVPDDAKPDEIIHAKLIAGDVTEDPEDPTKVSVNGHVIAADSFIVKSSYLEYPTVQEVVNTRDLTSEPTFDNPETADVTEEKPEGAQFELVDAAQADLGISVDPDTGVVTWANGNQSAGETSVPVRMRWTNSNGQQKEVQSNALFQLNSKQADEFTPDYGATEGEPGTTVPVDAPTFPDNDGNEVAAPEGTTFAPGEGAPEGVKVDENTGEITVPVPEDAKPGDKITVPVEVTYPDGTKETVDAVVTVKDPATEPGTPDVADNEAYEPGYTDGVGKPGTTVPVDAPTFTDNDGNEVAAPEGTTFKPGEGAPEGVKVDENTGEITVPVPEDAKPDDKITVPVEVTYPDGTKDTVDVTVTVTEPDAKDNETFEPGYEDGKGQPGSDVTVDAPTFTDKDGNDVTAPEGTTFKPGEGAPEGVKVDENTGEITVPVPEDAKPGDKITVPVEVTYPDGTKDTVDVTVTVTDPSESPNWEDGSTKPGEKVELPNKGGDIEDGTTVDVTEGSPGTAELNPDGSITVTPNEDAKPGDKIVVEVKDPEGNVIDTITVTIDEDGAGDDNTGSTGGSSELTEDELGRCIATGVGFGLPLLALVPLALGSQLGIPGLDAITSQVTGPIQEFNTMIQQQAGVFNPALANQVNQLNAQLNAYGADLGTVAAVVGGVAVAALAITMLVQNCTPGSEGSSAGSSESLGSSDAGSSDAGSSEGSSTDAGSSEGSSADAGSSDAESTTGSSDSESSNADSSNSESSEQDSSAGESSQN